MGGDAGDNLDAAAELQRVLNESAVDRHRMFPEWDANFDGSHCIDCGEDIPEVRLLLMRIRCFDCQTLKEKREKR